MIGLVRLALRRPYTSAITAMLLVLLGALSITRMIVDIFPIIDIPVVLVVWNYNGLSTEDMERRVVFISERAYSTTVNGISRIESQSIPGIGILKVYFQPGTEIGGAIAQIAAVNNTILRNAPPGMQPPGVIQFNASNVPVVQLTMSSKTLTEQQIYDYSLNFIRIKLFTIPGLSTPGPFGGKQRQINVDVDPSLLAAKGFALTDVVNALQASNVIVPAGIARIGDREYNVQLNSSPAAVDRFNALPLGSFEGAPVTIGDVGKASDSFATQSNVVHVNGKRAVYLAILKHADASTLAVVDAARDALPEIQAAAPAGLDLKLDFDQSVFVRAAVENVVREAIISSILVSVLILVFLGSWRNTVIVSASIPLSVFAGILALFLTGNSINLMTLGGLALAIGLLVDNATVTIENIHRNLTIGKPLTVAILDGCGEVIQPLTVATLAICIVFFPVVLLFGVARYLFIPLAATVVFCMLASYVLSFTVVPSFARFLLASAGDHHGPPKGFFGLFDRGFERFRRGYGRLLMGSLRYRWLVLFCFAALFVVTGGVATVIGMDFFPSSDVGLIKLHFRAPAGTRIEDTERLVLKVEDSLRQIIPVEELDTINDTVGVPSSFNLAFVPSDNVGAMDAEILVSLKPEHHPTINYIRAIRRDLPGQFPGSLFYFQTADIVSQVLNFGLPAPIDVQIQDVNFDRSYLLAQRLMQKMKAIPGVADAHLVQVLNYPGLQIDVDRMRAAKLRISQRDVASNMLTSLSSSVLVSPNFFLNPQNNVNYSVAVQTPIERINSAEDLLKTPVSAPATPTGVDTEARPAARVMRLADIASIYPRSSLESVNHYTVQRQLDIAANVDGRDLGATATDIQTAIDDISKDLPITTHINIRGQNDVMQASFRSLAIGMILAVILVYALLVILFQSWVDPFIIMMAVPGGLMGIIWMLALSGTTINVESLMGSIMTIGISVSNSILVVSFANDLRARGTMSALDAVIEAGTIRLRPVLMTALAMIIGMIPMALGLGEAGEQNAPLGRAVIGGLIVATFATLIIVPIFYTLLRRSPPTLHTLDARFAAEAAGAVGSGELRMARGLLSLVPYVVGVAVISAASLGGVHLWHEKNTALAASRDAMAEGSARGPVLQVATIAQGPTERTISLLADTRPYQTATLYSKVSGYVSSIAVDRGDHVKSGDLLASVSSVETDQLYEAAVHDLDNKKRTWDRQKELVARGWTSQQAADQAQTAYTMATATAAQNETLKSYEQIKAPFDGVVTARYVDVGVLVQNSTTNKTSNQPVLTIADDSKLRVDVYVEQRDVPFVHVGDVADVADGANSSRKVQARIARTSNELDQRTRTLFVELEVDNKDHFLVPGSFAYVTLHVPVQSYPEVPVAGLVVRGTRTFVADVGADSVVRMQPVTVANTDGIKASLADGAKIGQRVALNLPDEVGDGSRVQVPPPAGSK